MPVTKLRPSFAFTEERLEQLKHVVPEAFADGKVNWDVLREVLGEHLEDEGPGVEHFGLFWPGKREAQRLAAMPSKGTLVPVPGEGVDEATTRNIFIEGENLEVLKIMDKSYAGQVKMIYIDPPYNTGNDFVYRDDYREPLESYLRMTGQTGDSGELLTTNPRTEGRFHSNWLSMMAPRILVARGLLEGSGSLWISIDDGELATLKLLCNELFGEENFVATFIWEKRTTRENRRVFSFNHDYILCYAKDKDLFQAARHMLPLTEEALGRYSNPDNDSRGDWQSVSLNAQAGHGTPTQFYELTTPGGRRLSPPPGRCWSVTKERMNELKLDSRVWFGSDGNNVPRLKVFLSEANQGLTPHTMWKAEEVGTTDSAKKALIELFGGTSVYETPKPVGLLQRMIQISTDPQDLVMDFFSGSATLAQAVMVQNGEDGGKRRFILVQLPEPTPPNSDANRAGYRNVAEIGKERVRKAGRETSDEAKRSPGTSDQGFRVFRLQESSFKVWVGLESTDLDELVTLFDGVEDPLVDAWKEDDLLCEIMLLQGFPLDSQVRPQPEFARNKVLLVEAEACHHRLLVCLDKQLADETLNTLKLNKEDVFVCLDTALTDQAKSRVADLCTLSVI